MTSIVPTEHETEMSDDRNFHNDWGVLGLMRKNLMQMEPVIYAKCKSKYVTKNQILGPNANTSIYLFVNSTGYIQRSIN